MKVSKVINNNVVSCLDDAGRELVMMGKGLGFRCRAGDTVDPSSAEKVFRLDTPEEMGRLKSLFASLSPELLELCERIIDHANETLGHRLNESIYLTLTDHIQFALSRARKNMAYPNPLMTEVGVFYPGELAVGRYALEQIWDRFQVRMPDDEAASIALHIVNAEYDSSMNATMHAARVLGPIVQILEDWPGLKLSHRHLNYDELIVHIKFLAMQSFSRGGRNWAVPGLDQLVGEQFPEAFACAGQIVRFLGEKSGCPIPGTEQAYLALCIHRACNN